MTRIGVVRTHDELQEIHDAIGNYLEKGIPTMPTSWACAIIGTLLNHGEALLEDNERLRAAQITTLVACSRCGYGQRSRHMVTVDDDWLCVRCAGEEITRLREVLADIVAAVDADGHVLDIVEHLGLFEAWRRARAALNGVPHAG